MTRTVYVGDALEVLGNRMVGEGPFAIVTQPPDAAEVGLSIEGYRTWLRIVAVRLLAAAAPDGVLIVAVTDRRADGRWFSKAGIFIDEGRDQLLWHKIVLRRNVGGTDIHRPGYTHLLAFARSGGPGAATPDVIEPGELIWPNGLGIRAARFAVEFARHWSPVLFDPFVGYGTFLAVGEDLYDRVVGVDIDPDRVELARSLRISPDRWGAEQQALAL